MKIYKDLNKFHFLLILLVILFSAQNTLAALDTSPEKKRPQVVYYLESKDLESLKGALVKINLHLRQEGRLSEADYKVIIHGSAVRLFHKDTIDSELQYMLEWFWEEQIQVSLCSACVLEYGMTVDMVFPGLTLWNPDRKGMVKK